MKTADLDILLQEGEGVMLEYKEGISASFARELVALANTTARFFTAVFRPIPAVSEKDTPQVTHLSGTKLALSRHQVEILRKCHEDSLLVDIMVITGRSDRTKFRDQVLNPLLEAGFIEMTVPEKPRSPKQRYRTTSVGRAVLENAEKETQS